MTYADLIAALANELEIQATDADFVAILPRTIEYAENRIYRELNLDAVSTRLSGTALGSAATLTPNNRNLVLTVGTLVVLESINVVTPTGATPDSGVRNRLVRMSWDVLDTMFGSGAVTGIPAYFALQDAATIAVGPWPDQAYPVEIIGTIRPTPLSASNSTSTLSLYFPDLLNAACMVFLSGYTRNFSAQSDDPRMALSWESQYGTLLKSAIIEEARKKGVPVPGDV